MALGVVLFVWSDQTINAICMVLACGLVVMGAVNLARFFTDRVMNTFSGILGLVLVLVGVWLFARPSYIAVIVPIVIGVILAVHGMGDIRMAWETKQNGYEKWWSAMLLGIVSLAFGVICIVNAFGVVSLAMKFIGVALVYDGISDLWIVSRTAKAAKAMKQEADALDVPALKAVFAAGFEELDDMSGAKVGDKTMMDAVIPASAAIAVYSGESEAELFTLAAQAAEEGAENSKSFVSKFGRAKSYGAQTIGTPDAGAVSMARFFHGLAQAREHRTQNNNF